MFWKRQSRQLLLTTFTPYTHVSVAALAVSDTWVRVQFPRLPTPAGEPLGIREPEGLPSLSSESVLLKP